MASASTSASAPSGPAPPAALRVETTPVEDLTPPESADLETPLAKIGKTTIWGSR